MFLQTKFLTPKDQGYWLRRQFKSDVKHLTSREERNMKSQY